MPAKPRTGNLDRVRAHLRAEGGCWTASGIAAVLGINVVTARDALYHLHSRGEARSTGRFWRGAQRRGGRGEAVYEGRP